MWIVQYNDAMGVLDRFKLKSNPKNYPGWENQEFIRLLDDSALASDQKNRNDMLLTAENLITEEMPFACIYHWNSVFMQKENVKDFYISPIGSVHLDETYIEN